ncbi:ATP-dependent RNA helicase DBP3 OS=Cryptococcus neoformans var, neoformans serotype D (strain JEC21 / ATCC MYA-565) GN=DBP3 PE=3 SV=1 [Rhizoctonia solani AG-1 IB]|uniref:RNA helicase n=2 Tax=Thanatephorus cucumeris (strain AG1-IB / isolate 7/3/14) TaxID=1108050 RepID=A0A0B7FMZ4_THACB|nr:ATP-dependent RNA helicase DBP3 OS=Cryptococcus neoformans var, neoformans serotype D (strain JEC21 / ATCC MYA-565) GN=DBP3 PE=3 SV=1 [Rhizoctonia solani AG-1 IB]
MAAIETSTAAAPHVKKSKKSKSKTEDTANAEDTLMTNDDTQEPSKKDKKKRKKSSDVAAEDESSIDKAERKRRKKEAANAVVVEDNASVEPAKESKEDRKKRKAEKRAQREGLAQSGTPAVDAPLPTPPPTTSVSGSSTPTSSEAAAYLAKNNITIQSSSGEVVPILKFSQLASFGVDEQLMKATDKFNEPSFIQACSWPASLKGNDVVGIAETGSGKTLAFGLPALQHILSSCSSSPDQGSKKSKKSKKQPAATEVTVLVVAPTRELAIQTQQTLHELGTPFGIGSVCLYGGEPKDGQRKALLSQNGDGRITRIVVGTPGRLKDFVEEGVCDLSRVTYLVLDEADRMLDKGFENDIRSIIEKTAPMEKRQTLMFSATWPESVRRLASTFQRDPVRVTVGKDELQANSRVEQVVEVFDDVREKDRRLIQRLKELGHKPNTSSPDRVLIFALYKKECDRVTQALGSRGFHALAIHGDLSQPQRMKALDDFKAARTTLLVATDVAARGLDIPEVKAVINYTFPLTVEEYIHRIGRTGRGGKSGKSITFFTGADHERALAGEFARVLKDNGFDADPLKKFPMTIKKKTHGAYGAFFRDDIPADAAPKKIKF